MKTLIPLCLLVVSSLAGTASAQTAPVAAASAGTECVALSSDQQFIRKGADRSILMRNGSDHYIVHLQNSCSKAAFSKELEIVSPNNPGQLCGARASKLRTDSGSCDVARLEPISAESFASRARR